MVPPVLLYVATANSGSRVAPVRANFNSPLLILKLLLALLKLLTPASNVPLESVNEEVPPPCTATSDNKVVVPVEVLRRVKNTSPPVVLIV